MLSWLMEGLVQNFKPEECEVLFIFDNCTDDSVAAFRSLRSYWLDERGYKTTEAVSATTILEKGGHQLAIDHLKTTDCNGLLVFQDDMRLNYRIADDLAKLHAEHGEKLGLVGGRDGFDNNHNVLFGAPHSASNMRVRRLQVGEYEKIVCVNSGPIYYPRHLVDIFGGPDPDMVAFDIWEDYSYRTFFKGFVNIVLGVDITHTKFGRVTGSTLYFPELDLGRHDRAIYTRNRELIHKQS